MGEGIWAASALRPLPSHKAGSDSGCFIKHFYSQTDAHYYLFGITARLPVGGKLKEPITSEVCH